MTITVTYPATPKQISFYAKLAVEVAEKQAQISAEEKTLIHANATVWAGQQDKKSMSGHIDAMIQMSKRIKPKTGTTTELEEGYYEMDGGIFHVVLSKNGHPYAKKLLVAENSSSKGKWVYAAGAASALKSKGISPLSLEGAKTYGKMTGTCIRCGAHLTDPTSVSAGIGPICAGYWS